MDERLIECQTMQCKMLNIKYKMQNMERRNGSLLPAFYFAFYISYSVFYILSPSGSPVADDAYASG